MSLRHGDHVGHCGGTVRQFTRPGRSHLGLADGAQQADRVGQLCRAPGRAGSSCGCYRPTGSPLWHGRLRGWSVRLYALSLPYRHDRRLCPQSLCGAGVCNDGRLRTVGLSDDRRLCRLPIHIHGLFGSALFGSADGRRLRPSGWPAWRLRCLRGWHAGPTGCECLLCAGGLCASGGPGATHRRSRLSVHGGLPCLRTDCCRLWSASPRAGPLCGWGSGGGTLRPLQCGDELRPDRRERRANILCLCLFFRTFCQQSGGNSRHPAGVPNGSGLFPTLRKFGSNLLGTNHQWSNLPQSAFLRCQSLRCIPRFLGGTLRYCGTV